MDSRKKHDLNKRIEELKEELNEYIEKFDVDDFRTIKKSQELDKLIVEYQKLE